MSNRSTLRLSALSLVTAAAVSLASLALSGCAMGDIATNPAATATGAITFEGTAMGGSQAIIGGNVILWETDPGSTGYPSSSNKSAVIVAGSLTSTGAITTTASGFSISTYNNFTCATGDFFYITVTGGSTNGIAPGQPGAQVNNNSVQASALGPCSQFASTPSGNTNVKVTVNESTTIAFAYALGSFTYVDNSGTAGLQGVYVGAPLKNNAASGSCSGVGSSMTCVAAGLTHAFQNAYNLVDAYHTDGTQPTSARTTVPGNPLGSVPQANINALANVLQYCTNSAGGAASGSGGTSDGTHCGNLFANTRAVNCNATTCVPLDTLSAAISMARNASHNLSTLSGYITAATAFQPTLSGTLQSTALAITYSGPFGNTSNTSGVITAANVTTAGTGYSVGDVLTVAGGTGGTLTVATVNSGAIATVTLTSGGSGYASGTGVGVTGGTGTGAKFTITAVSGNGISPQYLALDANDDVFVLSGDLPTPTEGGVSAIGSNGTPLWSNGLATTFCVPKFLATDTVGNVWATNGPSSTGCGGVATAPYYGVFGYSQTSGALNPNSPSSATGGQLAGSSQIYGVAVDQYNNLWVDRYVTSTPASVFELAYSGGSSSGGTYGNQISQATTGLNNLNQIILDENQNVWVSTFGNASTALPEGIYVLPNLNAPATYGGTLPGAPSYPGGAAQTAYYSYSGPGSGGGYSFGVAIDSTGTVWDTASTTGTTSGFAQITPMATPTSAGVINGNPAPSTSIATITGSNAPLKVQEAEFDGAGQLWSAYNSSAGEVYWIYNPTGTAGFSGVAASEKGIVPCYAPNSASACASNPVITTPTGLQVDSTGAVWVSGKGSNTAGTGNGSVVQIIGTGAPTWPQLSYAHFGVEPQ